MENKPTYEELQAQVEALRSALINIRHSPDDHCAEIAADVLDKAPQQHLAEIRAQAAYSAYVHCLNHWSTAVKPSAYAGLAKDYVASIRKGEVK